MKSLPLYFPLLLLLAGTPKLYGQDSGKTPYLPSQPAPQSITQGGIIRALVSGSEQKHFQDFFLYKYPSEAEAAVNRFEWVVWR